MEAPKEIRQKALALCHTIRVVAVTWPDDYWFSLSENWDLNLWNDGETLFGSLYFVDDKGNTQTRDWDRVYEERLDNE